MRSLHSGALLLLLSPLSACGQLVGWQLDDDVPRPRVLATLPADLAGEVGLDERVIATFDQPMAAATLVDGFVLRAGTEVVPGTVRTTGFTATFEPDVSLEFDTVYRAIIRDTAANEDGLTLALDHEWTFTTSPGPLLEPPFVVQTLPGPDATSVMVGARVFALFSEPMSAATVTSTSFLVRDALGPIGGEVTQVGSSGIFTPDANFAPDTEYTATITTAATDLDGLPLSADHVWSFSTGTDFEAPYVVYTDPGDQDGNVSIDAEVFAIFSEPMLAPTVDGSTFFVMDGPNAVVGAVSYFGVTGIFTPSGSLDPTTVYTATVTRGAQDLLGSPLSQDHVWSFTTGSQPPLGDPTVVFTVPDTDETQVDVDSTVFAMFSEPMDALTLDDTSFLLTDGVQSIVGAVSQFGTTGSFTPAAPLDPDTLYTATITTAAADLDGVPLQADHVWSFTTDLDPDAPFVVYTDPVDLGIDVPLEAQVFAFFSEPMLGPTVDDTTFLLMDGATPVAGVVSYLGVTGTFTPTQWLDPNTEYTATVTQGAQDLLGTPLDQDTVWTFTTADVVPGLQPIDLGSLSTFVAVAGAGLTNSNSGGTTTLNGDVGLSPTATCMGDGSPCSLVNPVINGTLYANDPGGIAAQAKVDLTSALVDGLARPPGVIQADLAGLTLAPGVYTSTSTMTVAVGGTVVLDGQGDPNAVWIFQIGSSLTVNNDAQILLINGAKAKNVFWAAAASSTLGSNVSFQGSVLAQSSNSVGTGSSVVGRLLCTDGEITLLSNTITLPPL